MLFVIELGARQVRLVGVTCHPNGPWVVQRARELSMDRPEDTVTPRFLIRDRDTKFTHAFDDVFGSDGTQVIMTPVQAPNANAHAERWVRTVREECLDWMLIWGRRHLERVLEEYVRHYNDQRPHRGLTEASSFVRRAVSALAPRRPSSRSIRFGVGIVSEVWCMSTTRLWHEALGF